MPDPTTYSYTTAAAPEWAAEVAGDARDAEIARLQDVAKDLWEDYCDADVEIGDLKRELADVKAECCRLVDRNGDLEAENKRLMVAGGEVAAMRYLASHSLDIAIYKLELAMAGTPSVYPPSVPTAAHKPDEPQWLVEETTLYTLNERGTNRIYANFQGSFTNYKERHELAKRCRDALNSASPPKEAP